MTKRKRINEATPSRARRDERRALFYYLSTVKTLFKKPVEKVSFWCSSPAAFIIAFGVVMVWVFMGPLFHFSDGWLMAANTVMNIITFLLVFLIQNSQSRDTKAIHIKLAELIRATDGAHSALVDLEKLTDEELSLIHAKYFTIAEESREQLRSGKGDTHIQNVKIEG